MNFQRNFNIFTALGKINCMGGYQGQNSASLFYSFVITLLCFLILQFGLLVTDSKFVIIGFKYAIL